MFLVVMETKRAFIADILCWLLHYSWKLIQQFMIYQQRIYIRNSMLARPVFFTKRFGLYEGEKGVL